MQHLYLSVTIQKYLYVIIDLPCNSVNDAKWLNKRSSLLLLSLLLLSLLLLLLLLLLSLLSLLSLLLLYDVKYTEQLSEGVNHSFTIFYAHTPHLRLETQLTYYG